MPSLKQQEISIIASQIIEETRSQINPSMRIGRDEYERRWRRIQEVIRNKGFDLLYLCGSELDRSDAAWLTGIFGPMIERYGVILPVEGKPIVLAGSEGGHVIEESLEESGAEMAILKEFQISDEDYRWAKFVNLDDILRGIGNKSLQNMNIVIVSTPESIPYEHVLILQNRFGEKNVEFDPLLLQQAKYEKSDMELAIMQQANTIADAALIGMLAVTVPGVTELQVAGVGDYIMKELGAERTGFVTIVTSGKRGYTIIGPATHKIIRKGEIVSLGVSPTFNGYHGVIRRTVRAGEKPTKDQNIFIETVRKLYLVVMKAVKEASENNLPSNYIDLMGKEYLEKVKLKSLNGRLLPAREPYTFIHNTGCSECQEGYGAVTPFTKNPLGNNVSLMIDIALFGFEKRHKPLFPVLYAVLEDAFWKKQKEIGVYNRLPLDVQNLCGNLDLAAYDVNPYHKEFKI